MTIENNLMKNKAFTLFYITRGIIFIVFSLIWCNPVLSQSLKVATAANLQSVIKVLGDDFKHKTGITIEPIVSSSGNLTAQIKNGAPYDVFLSADMGFPESLFKDGFSAKKPVVYARGSLIICSKQNVSFDQWEQLLKSEKVKKIAVANPKIAPYGKAAEETLQEKGILNDIKPKIVYGESISQVNTYITTGAVEIGFTTQALVKDAANKTLLYWKVIDPATYAPIEQGMVLLISAGDKPDALKFYEYILSPAAKAIFEEYGYKK